MVYESNSIEGNILTLRETELVLSKGVTISGKPLKDHLEAVNLSLAWEKVKEMAAGTALRAAIQGEAGHAEADGSENRPCLTERDLLDLHRIVLTRVEDRHAGSYRSSAVRISGSKHIPPNPIKVPDLMTELFTVLGEISDPIERAAQLHHGIAKIHPFTDGNGRTARLAMNFVLLAAGFPPISIPTDQRQDYYNALEAADQGNFLAWQNFLTNQLHQELDTWLEALESALPENRHFPHSNMRGFSQKINNN
ncbi:MAG: Fic family protein [Akkermansiaceae bacterium]|nr:Fic family protein [Akkermansiaceae bacterium]